MTLELETPSRKLTCRAVCVCVVLACIWQAGAQVHPTGQSAQEEPRNIRVSDPALSKELAARGAELVADYQSFRVYRVDATSARALSRRDGVQTLRHANVIELNSGFLDTMLPSVKASRQAVKADANKHLRLVQFAGPVKPEWLNALESTGARVVAYVPHNAFLVYGTGTVLGRMQSWAASSTAVQWEGDYKPEYKVHPNARRSVKAVRGLNQTNALFSLQLIDDPAANPSTLALARSFAGSRIRKQWRSLCYLNVIALLPWDAVTRLSAQPEVVSIHRYIEPVKLDERQDQIVAGNLSGTAPSGPGYLAWLSSKGFSQSQFDASGFSVDVSDSGIDNGTTLPNHFGLYTDADTNQASRVIYNRVEGTPNENSKLEGCDGHGNLNAHIIAGFNDEPSAFPHTDPQGYHYGLGVCPFVSVGSSVIFDPNYFTYPDYAALQSEAYQDGARVSNNSWGAGMAGDYTVDCQTFDALVRDAQPDSAPFTNAGNQEMVIVFSSGNNGPGPQTVTSPGSAKNVITVGAAESVRSLSIANGGNDAAGSDGCALNDTNADSADDLTSFSSRGPCTDGRQKPDLVAPGSHITGGVAQNGPPPDPSGLGDALPCYDASGICALAGNGAPGAAADFFPTNQQFYTVSSGTSHAAPAVAGACALLRQYFLNQGMNAPSPAMTKAYLMNSTRYLAGAGAGDSLFSNNQGMGELNLGAAFDDADRVLRDQIPADKFTATGQTRTYTGQIPDSSKPFRVTLGWTDAPGNTFGNAYNNDLDLTVVVGGQTYHGNVFNGAYSMTGGAADEKNNVESVFLPAGASGSFAVTVTAANINSDGVPNEEPAVDQDFALVIYNAVEAPRSVIAGETASISAESCAPTNNAVDPGETVTLNFELRNAGLIDATNVVATLLETNGISDPSGPQNYGMLAAAGGSTAQPFTFTATGVCGGVISPTFRLQDGTNDLGLVTFTFSLGETATTLSEDFETAVAPSLPTGWATTSSGSQQPWTTVSTNSYDGTNCAFAPDASGAGLSDLVSPAMTTGPGTSQLSFQQIYDLEDSYDGGVLEIKIGNGEYTDILDAGGSFVEGGYSGILSPDGSSPLIGRQAWTGTSAGYVTTIVDLPPGAANQTVQFRWRCASDASVGYTGWFLDAVQLRTVVCCGQPSPPAAAFDASPVSGGPPPFTANFNDTSTGAITNRFWDFGNGMTTNTTATNFNFTYTQTGTNTVSLTVMGPGGTNTLTRMDYVIVTNPMPVLSPNGSVILAESCSNGVMDPGETVTVSFALRNSGAVATTNLTAALMASGAVLSPSGPQNYGAIPSGGSAAGNFTFTALGNCGGRIDAILQLQDGSQALGQANFSFVLGQAGPFSENFDAALPPGLPTGWTTSASDAQSPWISSTTLADTAPNAAFSTDPDGAGLNELVTPPIDIPDAPIQMSFRQSYDLEAPAAGSSGYDGGVLEIAIDGGAFEDIIDAGGNFVSGGYNRALSSAYGNPLGGRQAWSGNSGGFISTVVNLPAAALGHSVQLRWACGSDQSKGAGGWRVDSISVGGFTCCENPPVISAQPTNQTVLPGQSATFHVEADGSLPLIYQWRLQGSEIGGATGSTYFVPDVQAQNVGAYDVVITNLGGAVTSSPAMLAFPPAPVLVSPRIGSNGHFSFTITGSAGYNFEVQATTNFSNWNVLGTLSNGNGAVPFADTNLPARAFRGYRARLIP